LHLIKKDTVKTVADSENDFQEKRRKWEKKIMLFPI